MNPLDPPSPEPAAPGRPSPTCELEYLSVQPSDFEALLQIRILAMRPSLEAIGRFDPQRARDRLAQSFSPPDTEHICYQQQCVGFYAVTETADSLFLEHLYILPSHQGKGIGAQVVEHLKTRSRACHKPISLLALAQSPSNQFYARQGFCFIAAQEWDNLYTWTDPTTAS